MPQIAQSMYCVALRLAQHEAGPEAYVAIKAAIDRPSPETIRAVLAAGVGQPWRMRIEHALIEMGIAASDGMECK